MNLAQFYCIFIISRMVTSGGLNRILKDWDSANGDQRKHLLGEFCDLTRNKTALDMQGSV